MRRNLNDKISSPHHRDDLLRAMQDFDRFCDDQARFFDRFETVLAFHFYALATNSKFRQRGLGSIIFNAALDMIKNFGLKRAYIKGEASSNYSRRIYERAGFEVLFEQFYSTYFTDRKTFFIPETGTHSSMTLFGLKILSGE